MRRILLLMAAALLIALPARATGAPTNACTGNRAITSQTELDAFIAEGCTSLSGDLSIEHSSDIMSLTGLDALTDIGGYLYFFANRALTSLDGLENVTSVGGFLGIAVNDALTSLDGLENITSVGGHLYIHGTATLTSLAGLKNVTSVGGDLFIAGNDALTSLAGLGALTSVGGSLTINGNFALTSLTGLDALTSVGENLSIHDNPALIDCACGLRGLATETSPGTFAFTGIGGTVRYSANGGQSCNSSPSVLAAMSACPTDTAAEAEEIDGFALAQAVPTPTAGMATIRFSLEAAGEARLSVYDVLGREVARLVDGPLAGGAHGAALDGATLPSGVYVYRLTANGQALTGTLTVAR